ncbi:LysR family transcriptional regulator [Priestia flexa]|uniref:Transcriptional regulator n=1 Tax=Priestia veravalensis TaxID=1414648 RepID=A0A0V8JGF2_9BACI|nr:MULTISPECIES: LysR family transcriptional regulator [Priestia]KSU86132.1 transcriptional regulator [Priestia veravalensis]MBY6088643.1 LysR family transcriptional regulator [Priestia flexa]MCP1190184.1 LysR family transcriptional regulator [Priestia flexa]MED4589615.1 LysR family transcriptional regulator [Priestia flexa]SCC56964.1 transcriptional regulator, LysR family [Priestia flexa]
MNLHALRLFYTVAEKRSVTRAAEELNISQPAVTAQIKKLEQEIDLTLVSPKGRGIFLTPAGEQLAKHAKRLFSLEREIESSIKQYRDGTAGKLRIVATYLPANFLLPKWIGLYKQQYPEVEVELITTNSSKAIDYLINYQAEIALIGGKREFHSLITSNELFEDQMLFIVHKNHKYAGKKVALSEIVREPFVFREEGSSSREKLFSLCKIHNVSKPIIGLQINGLNETIRTVIAGYGVTFVSSLEVNEHLAQEQVAIVHVEEVNLKNPISLCTREKDELSKIAFNFIDSLKNDMN